MDWGSHITYFGQTSLKGQTVKFGIKDADRTEQVALIGKRGSGRASLLTAMALQDVERGMGVVVIDGAGNFTELLLERLDEDARKRLIYLDPSDAEYPFSWNPLDDFRLLPKETALPLLIELVTSLYRIPVSPLVSFACEEMLVQDDATLLLLFEIVREHIFRDKKFPKDTPERATLDSLLSAHKEDVELITQNGRYLAKDTLVRNLLGQQKSAFTLTSLNEGSIVVLDLSRIRMFPTRMTPLARLFLHMVRVVSGTTAVPPAVYLHDCVRCFSITDVETIFPERKIAITTSDAVYTPEDALVREKIFLRSASVIAFSPGVNDVMLVERIFFPFIAQEDFSKLETEEIAVALSIDSVRSRPFFARTIKVPERKNVSYHDIQVISRERHSSSRVQVDQQIMRRYTAPSQKGKGKDGDPGSFSDAFRNIFAKRTGDSTGPKPPAPPPSSAQAPKSVTPAKGVADTNRKSSELPEDELRQMLYVEPLSL